MGRTVLNRYESIFLASLRGCAPQLSALGGWEAPLGFKAEKDAFAKLKRALTASWRRVIDLTKKGRVGELCYDSCTCAPSRHFRHEFDSSAPNLQKSVVSLSEIRHRGTVSGDCWPQRVRISAVPPKWDRSASNCGRLSKRNESALQALPSYKVTN